jgi:hypothetical protein
MMTDEIDFLSKEQADFLSHFENVKAVRSQDDRPWMAALEAQFAALRTCRVAQGQGKWKTSVHGEIIGEAISQLSSAETYAWSHDSAMASWLAARTIPSDTRLLASILPSASGWWWFDQGLDEPEFVALLWGPTRGGLELFCFVHTPKIAAPVPGFSFRWPFDASVHDLLTNVERGESNVEGVPTLRDLARFFLAACLWLQQRVVTSSAGHIERHRRKQIARENDVPLPSDVKVIQLRRTESRSQPANGNGEVIDWSCRWIVNGHWRNQPYADERKLIYIMPFVKGPADKPLRVPTHTVYQVSR